jgi:SAM-dependent methyltransferase
MKYLKIVERYEKCFAKHGDSHLGVEWKSKEAADIRYEIMLGLIKEPGSVLDFGCGTAGLKDYIGNRSIDYTGLDISDIYLNCCKAKYPDTRFLKCDVLKEQFDDQFDYVLMNGIFTAKDVLSYEEMYEYFTKLVSKLFINNTRKGLVFNVMSKHVDYEKDYLFHLPIGIATDFIATLSRNFVLRHDYGLYEYSIYLYK